MSESQRISVGGVEVEVTPNAEGIDEKLKAQTDPAAAKAGTSAGKKFSDGFNTGVEKGTKGTSVGPDPAKSGKDGTAAAGAFADAFKAKLRAAAADLPSLDINADSSEADIAIAAVKADLEELSNKTIGIDLSDTDALAQLDILQARLDKIATDHPSVSVELDTAAASAHLDEFKAKIDELASRSPKVNVDVETKGAEGNLAALAAEMEGTQAITVGLRASLISLAVVSLAPLAAGLVALGGPLTAVAVGLGGMAAVAVPAISEIKKALDAQKKSVAAVATTQKALVTANANVASSEQSLADTKRTAADQAISSAEAVQNAEQSLADAESQSAKDRVKSAQAITDAQTQAAQQQTQAIQAVQDAERSGSRSIAAAEQAVADARTQAAQQQDTAVAQVKSAEQSLVTAQQSSLAAQKALTDARTAAAEQLKQLSFQTADAALNERGDKLSVQSAKQQLDATNANKAATKLQKQEAQLAYDQAVQQLKEQQDATKTLAAQKADADKKGVKGSDQVVTAQQNLAKANQTVKDQQQGLADAQKNVVAVQLAGAKSVSDAQLKLTQTEQDSARSISRAQANLVQTELAGAKSVAAARSAAADQAVTDAERVKSAQQSVGDAQRAQAQQAAASASSVAKASDAVTKALAAQKSAQGKASAATLAAKGALDSLTPSEKAALKGFQDLKDTFSDWARALQPAVLPAFTGALGLLQGALKPLTPAVSGAAGAVDGLERSATNAFKSPFWSKFATFLGKESGKSVTAFGTAVGSVATGLAGLFEGLAPLGDIVLSGLDEMTDHFKEFGKQFSKTGPSKDTVKNWTSLRDSFVQLGDALGHLLGSGFKAFIPVAAVLFTAFAILANAISAVLGWLQPLFNFMAGHKTLFAALAIGIIAAVVAFDLLTVAVGIFNAVASPEILIMLAIAAVIGVLVFAIVELVKHWQTVKNAIITAAQAVWTFLKKWGLDILVSFNPLIAIPLLIWQHWSKIKGYVVGAFKGSSTWLLKISTSLILGMWKGITIGWRTVSHFFANIGHTIVGWFKSAGSWLKNSGTDLINGQWAGISNRWGDVAHWFDGFGSRIKGYFKSAKSWLSSAGTDIIDGLGDGLKSAAKKIGGWLETPFNDVIDLVNRFIGLINKIPGVNIKTIGHVGASGKAPANRGVSSKQGNQFTGGSNKAAAHGGVLGGYGPGKDTEHVMLSKGEGVLVPEAVRGLGAGFVHAANAHFSSRRGNSPGFQQSGGMQHFSFGGIVKDVGKFGEWAGKSVKKGAEAVNPVKLVGKAFDAAVGGAFSVANAAASRIPTDIGKQIGHGILGTVKNAVLHDGHADTKKAIASGGGGGGTFISAAEKFKGQPYVWGGAEPGGFDCSGLTSYIMNTIGHLNAPRTASEQEKWASPLSAAAALPGDLIFYGGAIGKGGAHHVAFNEGNGKMFEAQQTGVPLGEYPIRKGGIYGRAPGAKPYLGGGLDSIFGNLFGGSSDATSGSLGAAIKKVLGLLHEPQSEAGDVAALIAHESTNNQFAVNKSDINWRNGTPSVGYAQVIGPTFAKYAEQFRNTGPFEYGVSTNPVANIFAGMNYGKSVYGSIENIPGIASLHQGGGYKPYDNGGYLQPGFSTVYNGLGKPEPVFTPDQWGDIRNAKGGGGGGNFTGNLYIGNELLGVVDGRIESALDDVATQVSHGRNG